MVAIELLANQPQWLDTIVQWHHSEWVRTTAGEDSPLEIEAALQERKRYMQEHLRPKTVPVTFVAHCVSRPLGTVSLVHYALPPSALKSVWLTNLYVAADQRGQGLGGRLLQHACHWAAAHRLGRIRLYTFDAAEFYLARGWEFVTAGELRGQSIDVLQKIFP